MNTQNSSLESGLNSEVSDDDLVAVVGILTNERIFRFSCQRPPLLLEQLIVREYNNGVFHRKIDTLHCCNGLYHGIRTIVPTIPLLLGILISEIRASNKK